LELNEQFLVNTLVIGVGWMLRRFLLDEAAGAAVVKITLNVTLPALIVSTFSTVRFDRSLALLPALAVGYALFMAVLGPKVLFRRRPRPARGQASYLLPAFNVGLFAYPLIESALGRDGLKYLAMFDMGVAVSTFVVVFAVGRHYAPLTVPDAGFAATARDSLRSVPLVVYGVTLLLSALGVRYPPPFVALAHALAPANMPLALLGLGMFLHFDGARRHWRDLAQILGLRFGFGLAVGLALYFTLPYDPIFRAVVLAALLLPPPVTSLAYAVEFGYDAPFVGLLLNVANVVGYFVLWGVFNFVRHVPGAGALAGTGG
jgi:predicted permease